MFDLFLFLRTLRREAGLVLKKNVANLCRYTYIEGNYPAADDLDAFVDNVFHVKNVSFADQMCLTYQ